MAEPQFYKVTIEGWLPCDPADEFYFEEIRDFDYEGIIREMVEGDGTLLAMSVDGPKSEAERQQMDDHFEIEQLP